MSQSLFLGHDYTNNTVKRVGVSSGGSIKTEPATEKTIAAAFSGSVADAAESSEIDMSGHKHLHIYGGTSSASGSFVLQHLASSGGVAVSNDYNIVFSYGDPLGSAKMHFSAKFENIGAQYVKIVAVGAMTAVDLRASKYN